MVYTICIPSFNRAHTIRRALNSLINQSFKDFEIIIIDDGSTDNTEKIISLYKNELNLIYIKKQNGGKHTALNLGIKIARGEFFIILDSDDWLDAKALEKMKYIWDTKVREKNMFCGIMGRCADGTGDFIGKPFPNNYYISSYIDFHYKSGYKIGGYGDCCEFIKTDILKKYTYPENQYTKFIPESFIMDKIGLQYKLLCTNEIYKYVEYLDDGITKNNDIYIRNNVVGYIINLVSKLEDIFPSIDVSFKCKISFWRQYWNLIKFDKSNYATRVSQITFIGYMVKIGMKPLNYIAKIKKHMNYKEVKNE